MRLLHTFCFATVMGFAADSGVTFHKEVLPVLQAKCQSCHRPGEAAPFSLESYEQARPWAKAMKEAVLAKRMPPWFADPHVGGKFVNDWSLAEAEIKTLAAWADQGALEGKKSDGKPNPVFTNGWRIPEPDMVFEMPEPYVVPGTGTVGYTYYILPTGLSEDKWVQLAEARPGYRGVVHHIIAFVREPGSQWLAGSPVNKGFMPGKGGKGSPDGFLAGFAPGTLPTRLRAGQAMLLKAGSDIVFQMHYTTNGKAGPDQSKVGLVFAKEPVKQRVHMLQVQNGRFTIPAGATDHPVAASLTLGTDVELLDLQPHMHARGKTALMKAVYPTGEEEKLLSIRWDFNWQLAYEYAPGKMMPKGTRIEGLNTYDNSPNNKFNPDPKLDVKWGDQSWEEMMINFFRVAVDVNVKPGSLVIRTPVKPAAD